MTYIKLPINIPLTNVKTGDRYYLRDLTSIEWDDNKYIQLVNICNEPEIYDILFRFKFKGELYSKPNAEKFIKEGKIAWDKNEFFRFLITDENDQLAGALDVKSNDLNGAEIGYWASNNHHGIISSALQELVKLAKIAGFKKLFASVRKNNQKSQKVLKNNGFHNVGDFELLNDKVERYRFELEL